MLKQVTLLNGVMCTTTHHTFKFLGSVERCWACRFTIADYFSARSDSFLIAIAHVALVDTVRARRGPRAPRRQAVVTLQRTFSTQSARCGHERTEASGSEDRTAGRG